MAASIACLYLQLLYQQADNLSREIVPSIFGQKKYNKKLQIGVRSEDLRDSPEKSIKGSGIALSSPRLVMPAAIHGLRVLSHQYFANDPFDFQLVPAMSGVFVYKAAALVQAYRDNDDLKLVFPDSGEVPSDSVLHSTCLSSGCHMSPYKRRQQMGKRTKSLMPASVVHNRAAPEEDKSLALRA
ncbi:uncharacterized protein LOC133699371 [Populus nigra]|uniref:uncharacterized protein LOC133699371 n=1 Tax=Populus nigra TaxID=3691 RepID=UPI002B26A93A|nr:uncharacterized protein LOC133699371 [Populus nigra]